MKRSILLFGMAIALLTSCKNSNTSGSGTTAAGDGKENNAESIQHPKIPAAQGTPRILFVGNSHTEFFVSMPKLFEEICAANKQPMAVDKLVTMAVDISEIYNDHKDAAEKEFAKADDDGNYYDYVVLQEKTPVALQELDKYKANVKMIVEKIRKNSPGAAVYIYEGMSPVPYEKDSKEYQQYYEEMRNNAVAVMKESGNAGLLRLGDAVKDAYNGKEGYQYMVGGKDNLRFGENTLHALNDAGFLEAVLLYATIFDKKPQIPAELTLSAGTGDNDGMKKMAVAQNVSNANALAEIAYKNR